MKNKGRALIFDCEIINCIPNSKEPNNPKYKYCGGWTDYANMGIATIGVATLDTPHTVYFAEGGGVRLEYITDLLKDNFAIGFNSKNFDDKLLQANGINLTTDYDVLEQIRIAAYGSPAWQDCPKGFSYSLDAITAANGFKKTGHGALAPQLWQDGKRQEVIDYCLNDCRITKEILLLGLKGELRDPNTGKFLRFQPPKWRTLSDLFLSAV
jgi:DEAD/DEAH box helicase domain-containing protein